MSGLVYILMPYLYMYHVIMVLKTVGFVFKGVHLLSIKSICLGVVQFYFFLNFLKFIHHILYMIKNIITWNQSPRLFIVVVSNVIIVALGVIRVIRF